MRPFTLALLIGVLHFPRLTAEERIEPRYEGKPVTGWLERLRNAGTREEQDHAFKAIEAFGADAATVVPGLVEMLEDLSPEYREKVQDLLCKIGPGAKDAVPLLVKALQRKNCQDQKAVIMVLGSIGPDAAEAVPVLTAWLGDSRLYWEATQALCAIGPKARAAIPALGQAIRQARRERRVFFPVESFHQLGPDVVPLLTEILVEGDLRDKLVSASALGQLGPAAQSATARLAPLLQDQSPELRYNAAVALWKIEKHDAVIPILTELLENKEISLSVSEKAAKTLGEIGPCAKGALPALEAFHRSLPSSFLGSSVREEVARAITKIQGADR
jgi:HEAT repeat protein